MTATIKPDWKLPEPPKCLECGEPLTAVAHHTGDGWVWHWYTTGNPCWHEPEEFDTTEHQIDWPFVEEWVKGDDWTAAGFEVV